MQGANIHAQAVPIDGHRRDRSTSQFEGRPRAQVTRIFDPYAVTGIEQRQGQSVEGLLRAVEDDHLFGFAPDTTELRQVARKRRLELRQSARVGKREAVFAESLCRPRFNLLPELPREFAGIRHASVKRPPQGRLSAGGYRGKSLSAARWRGMEAPR